MKPLYHFQLKKLKNKKEKFPIFCSPLGGARPHPSDLQGPDSGHLSPNLAPNRAFKALTRAFKALIRAFKVLTHTPKAPTQASKAPTRALKAPVQAS